MTTHPPDQPAEPAQQGADPEQRGQVAVLDRAKADRPWVTLVWNDPVNLMSYVTYVFQSHFGYSRSKAESLMMQVHRDGRAVVSSGPREKVEADTEAMHSYGLWATFQKDD